MNAAVIDDLDLGDLVASGFEDAAHGMAKEVVPEVTEVKGFVGVGRAVLDHHMGGAARGLTTVIGCSGFTEEPITPELRIQFEVEESFHHVEVLDRAFCGHEGLSEDLGRGVRFHPAVARQREADEGAVTGELAPGLLDGEIRWGQLHAKRAVEGLGGQGLKVVVEAHVQRASWGRNTSASMQRTEPPPRRSMVGMGA